MKTIRSGRSGSPAYRIYLQNLRIFIEGAWLSYVALFRWLSPSAYIAAKVAMPLSQMIFFTLLGMYAGRAQGPEFFFVGNSVHVAAVSGIFGVTMSVSGERNSGTLSYLIGAPANRLIVFVGRAFFHIFDGIIGAGIGMIWGLIILPVNFPDAKPVGIALAILAAAMSSSALGLILGCLGLLTRNIWFVNNTVYFLLLFLCGSNVPIDNFPPWLQVISRMLPLTRSILSARMSFDGAALNSVMPELMIETTLGMGYMLVGYALFRAIEVRARSAGSLEAI